MEGAVFMASYLFTSESVGAGHPDKLADQISDAVLDSLLRQAGAGAPQTRCACEVLVKTGVVIVAGEFRPGKAGAAAESVEALARATARNIGYTSAARGLDADECAVINIMGEQSADIARGVDGGKPAAVAAGDQGLMFGYACQETRELMPLPIQLSHNLMRQHAKARKELPWLGPDAKAQVSVRYNNNKPEAAEAVVLSSQHDDRIDGKKVKDNDKRVRAAVIQKIIAPVLAAAKLKMPAASAIYVNPTGRFVTGGPKGDCGLTGRKIIVDTYGGAAPHGGGAFSGKDPTKVDRSAAYMMRYIAKNVVAAGLASRCLIQTAYAIGVAEPVSLFARVEDAKMSPREIERRIRRHFDLTPGGIIKTLDLWKPVYLQTAAYGHFGRPGFAWEKTDKADLLRA
jgi:S-adenosylmethionine synthetase